MFCILVTFYRHLNVSPKSSSLLPQPNWAYIQNNKDVVITPVNEPCWENAESPKISYFELNMVSKRGDGNQNQKMVQGSKSYITWCDLAKFIHTLRRRGGQQRLSLCRHLEILKNINNTFNLVRGARKKMKSYTYRISAGFFLWKRMVGRVTRHQREKCTLAQSRSYKTREGNGAKNWGEIERRHFG